MTLTIAPRSQWLMGHMPQFQADALDFLTHAYRLGDIVRFRFGPFPLYVMNSPQAIHEVLVSKAASFYKSRGTKGVLKPLLGTGLFTSDGEFWRGQRKLVSPAFHTKRIARYAQIMVGFASTQADTWRDGAEIDTESEMAEITMHIIAKAGFDSDVTGDEHELRGAVEEALSVADENFNTLLRWPYWIPTAKNRRFLRAIARLDTLIQRVINDRRAGRTGADIDDKGDALSMLLAAVHDEDGRGMTDKQLRDEIMTLFGAGHETTAKALTWAWYVLSQHADIQARLHDELDTVLGGRMPTMDDLPSLPYLDRFLKEVLRIYPPAWVTTRDAIEPVDVLGVPLKRSAIVIINIYGVHRDPAIYPDPLRFDPDRWTPEFERSLPKGAYLPFGSGPRVCVGNAFAQMEAKLVLAVLAQRFTLRLRPGHTVEPEDRFTLRPKFGLPMIVHKRGSDLAQR